MNKPLTRVVFLLVAFCFVAVGCGPAETETPATESVVATTAPTAAATTIPTATATAPPPTATPAPTATATEIAPTATATQPPTPATNEGMLCAALDLEVGADLPDLDQCTLRIAVENVWNPFNYINDQGTAVGYDYDIFADICDRLNCVPEFVETRWDDMVAIMAGAGDFDDFDVIADGIIITEDRARYVAFSEPYIQFDVVLITRSTETRFDDAQTLAATTEAVIGVGPDDTAYQLARDLAGLARVVRFSRGTDAMEALVAGEVDALIADSVVAQYYLSVYPDAILIAGEPLLVEALGFVLPQDSSLTAVINLVLAEMEADGTLAALFELWFTIE